MSAPAFASGILLLYVFAVVLGWFPVFGSGNGFFDRLYHLALPAFSLALTAMALVVKLTRTAMIDALDQDYVAFARARGISYGRVLTAYALRNALVPVVTASGLILGYMLTGAVLVEITFALPGMGSLLVESVELQGHPGRAGHRGRRRDPDRARQPAHRHPVRRRRPAHPLRGRRVSVTAPDRHRWADTGGDPAGESPFGTLIAAGFIVVIVVLAAIGIA